MATVNKATTTNKTSKKERSRIDSANDGVSPVLTRSGGKLQTGDALVGNEKATLYEEQFQLMESHLSDKIQHLFTQLEDRLISKLDESLHSINARLSKSEAALTKLQHDNKILHNQIDDMHRIQRLSDVIIRGVPTKPNENVFTIVKKIASVIEHPLSPYIDAFRLKSRSSASSSSIIARFSCHQEQKTFLSAFYKRKGIKLSQLDGFSSASPVYVSESLTPLNNFLLREALKLRKSEKVHTATTRNGFLYIRRGNNDQLEKITNPEQLHMRGGIGDQLEETVSLEQAHRSA